MQEQAKSEMKPIRKEILNPGNAYIELKPGTRVSASIWSSSCSCCVPRRKSVNQNLRPQHLQQEQWLGSENPGQGHSAWAADVGGGLIAALVSVAFQVKFHFQTRRAGTSRIIDDSRKMEKPMELVLGKKFKLEVWEVIVQQMSLNEVAKFTVHKSVSGISIGVALFLLLV